MSPEFAERWISYLEGKDKHVLELANPASPDERCCLGHLCEMYREETGLGKWELNEEEGILYFIEPNGGRRSDTLPNIVMRWAGLHDHSMREISKDNDEKEGFPVDTIRWYAR